MLNKNSPLPISKKRLKDFSFLFQEMTMIWINIYYTAWTISSNKNATYNK